MNNQPPTTKGDIMNRNYKGKHRKPSGVGRKIAVTIALAGLGIAGAVAVTAPKAGAVPGQCVQVGVFGGFCDGPMLSNGTWRHCENGMGIQNCFYVRPVPTDVDARGWVPA